jgi:nitrite reductase (NADH) large subunit
MKPQHAQLFAEDLTEEQVIRYLDRFLMFYIRTAERLQRTSTWLNNLEGGIGYLREVVIEDSLGIGDELERDMERIVGTYQCEWRATLEDESKLQRFRHFINSDQADPNIVTVEERGQKRPAYAGEREALIPVDLVGVR